VSMPISNGSNVEVVTPVRQTLHPLVTNLGFQVMGNLLSPMRRFFTTPVNVKFFLNDGEIYCQLFEVLPCPPFFSRDEGVVQGVFLVLAARSYPHWLSWTNLILNRTNN
jgi:hypothetical protein